jgi:5-methylcytosine-specific restriction endonuclease McrA
MCKELCTVGLPVRRGRQLTKAETKELEKATAMKEYCGHCLEIYNRLSKLDEYSKVAVPKEKMALLPGKQSSKKVSEMAPEEYEQHRIFQRAYSDLYKELVAEQLKEYQRLYHINYKKNHPDKLKAYHEKNYKENPEYYNNHARLRRARELEAYREPYSTDDVLRMWGIACHLCGEVVDLEAPRHVLAKENDGWQRGLHLDHVIPLSQGGPDIVENVKPSHAVCNLSRSREVVDMHNPPSPIPDKVLTYVDVTMYYDPVPRGRKKLPR